MEYSSFKDKDLHFTGIMEAEVIIFMLLASLRNSSKLFQALMMLRISSLSSSVSIIVSPEPNLTKGKFIRLVIFVLWCGLLLTKHHIAFNPSK